MSKTMKRLLWGYVLVIGVYAVLAVISSRGRGVVTLDDIFGFAKAGKSAGR